VVEGNAGGRKRVLNVRGDASGVTVRRNGKWAMEVGVEESGGYILSDGISVVEVSWDLTVFYVPPNGYLRRRECTTIFHHPKSNYLTFFLIYIYTFERL